MKYQLIVQFQNNSNYDFDWLIEVEDKLIETLRDAEEDGHDIGSGEMNIFIFTNTPTKTFETVKNVLKNYGPVLENTKIAYREVKKDQYFCLWPKGLTEFMVV